MKQLKEEQINKIKSLYLEGRSIREINKITGFAKGTIRNHLVKLGIRKILPPSQELSIEQKELIKKRCEEGKYLKDIAIELKIDRGTVGKYLRSIGLSKRITKEEKEIIKQMYKVGKHQSEIANELGFTRKTVNYWWKQWGFDVRDMSTRETVNGIERKCKVCNIWKPIERFHKYHSRNTEYRSKTCSKCKYEQSKEEVIRDDFRRWVVNVNHNAKRQGADGRLKKSDFENHIGHWKDNVCYICGYDFEENTAKPLPMNSTNINDWKPQLDHIIPLSQGGKNIPENIKWSHRYCNGHFKRGYLMEDLIQYCKLILNRQGIQY